MGSPFTKILIEVHRVLRILEPGRPPSDLKSPFIEGLMQQVVALTNIGASLTKRRKLTKEVNGSSTTSKFAIKIINQSFTHTTDSNVDEKRI